MSILGTCCLWDDRSLRRFEAKQQHHGPHVQLPDDLLEPLTVSLKIAGHSSSCMSRSKARLRAQAASRRCCYAAWTYGCNTQSSICSSCDGNSRSGLRVVQSLVGRTNASLTTALAICQCQFCVCALIGKRIAASSTNSRL